MKCYSEQATQSLRNWTNADVRALLRCLNMAQYENQFVTADGNDLALLSEQLLTTQYHIQDGSARARLLDALSRYAGNPKKKKTELSIEISPCYTGCATPSIAIILPWPSTSRPVLQQSFVSSVSNGCTPTRRPPLRLYPTPNACCSATMSQNHCLSRQDAPPVRQTSPPNTKSPKPALVHFARKRRLYIPLRQLPGLPLNRTLCPHIRSNQIIR